MCDIDHFKLFNDTWGHQTGDQVLRLVGHCLSENVKGRDTAARYGGEEFVVILRQTGLDSAVSLANQIRANVESKKLVKRSTGDILGTITISIGVAQLHPGESPSSLIERADTCLYAAKNAGRNRVMSEARRPWSRAWSRPDFTPPVRRFPFLPAWFYAAPLAIQGFRMRKDFERCYVTTHGTLPC